MKTRSFMWLAPVLLLTGVFLGCKSDGGDAVPVSIQKPILPNPGKDPPPTPVNEGVTIQPGVVWVRKGASQPFTATVTVGSGSESLVWSAAGSGNGGGTTINPTTGLLTVGANETAKELTIKATLSGTVYYGEAYALVIGNEDPPELPEDDQDPSQSNDIRVSPLLTMLGPGDTESFTAELPGEEGSDTAVDITESAEWDVGSEAGSVFEGNELTVAQNETAETLLVRASLENHSGNAFVTVLGNEENPVPVNSGVRVSPQTAAIVKGTTLVFSAHNGNAAGSQIGNDSLTWQVFGGDSGTEITGSTLTVAESESAKHLIVRAKTNSGNSYGTAVVWVIGNGYPGAGIDIVIGPSAVTLGPGDTQTFDVSLSDGIKVYGATWTVDGSSTFAGNLLTVAANETAETLTVTANLGQSLAGEAVFGVATVTVLGNESNPVPINNGVWLSPDISAVVKGKTVAFSAYNNSGKTESGKITTGLVWQVFGGISGTGMSGSTLTVAAGESAKHLIVRAKTTSGSYSTAVVWVIGNGYPEAGNSVVVGPSTVTLTQGGTKTFDASFSDGIKIYGAMWTVNSTNGSAFNGNTLTVATGETAETLTVTANLGGGLSGTATVTVLSSELRVNGITVLPGKSHVVKGWTRDFEAYNSTGTSKITSGLSWELFGGGAGTTIVNGKLTVAANETATVLIVKAKTTEDNYGTAVVQIGDLMVQIPGGQFTRSDGTITVSAFSISRYEVTQKQWAAVMSTTIEEESPLSKGPWGDGLGINGQGDNYPMYHVTWYQAVEYCNALSEMEGLDKVYNIGTGDRPTVTADFAKNGYRLPTEAEWEYAARGGQTYKYAGSNTLGDVAWYGKTKGNSDGKTHPVGEKLPNGYGLYDMNGNVWEWCWDWFADYATGNKTDPTGPASGTNKINRGADWFQEDSAVHRLSSRKTDDPPITQYNTIGFRVVRRP